MSKLSNVFNIVDVYSEEKKKGMGEDYFSYSYPDKCHNNSTFIAVFDGCGGIGAKRYMTDIDTYTGAYLASRACAYKTSEYYDENGSFRFDEQDAVQLKSEYKKILSDIKNKYSNGGFGLKGSLASKSFPTTASVISVKYENKTLFAEFLWVGDSRGYVLDDFGLKQITKDDLYGDVDALSNISNDAGLSNVINSDTDFEIHSRFIKTSKPSLFISATDGCFGYLPTPMHFEYVVLNSICQSNSVNEFEDRIKSFLAKVSGDDFTIGIIAAGFESFDSMRMYFLRRENYVYDNYIKYLDGSDNDEVKSELWEKYKKDYYKY